MSTATEILEAGLVPLLARQVPGFKALQSAQRLTAGASQETYRLLLSTDEEDVTLALRRNVPTLAAESLLGTIGPGGEAKLMQLAARAGIPEPEVVYVLTPEDGLGEGFIMSWLEGETLGNRIVRSDSFAHVRPQLAFQCGEILGRLHTLSLDDELAEFLPQRQPTMLIDETYADYQALGIAQPMIDYSWRWLRDNVPSDFRMTLVHGDFRNGNLMVTPQGITAVLDWELAHVGDPVRDLGWLCVNSWRFGNRELPVGGFGEIADLLAGYKSVTGQVVAPSHLKFWQVFGSYWWAVTCLRMAATWRSGETPGVERPVIGRRSSEAQMDCVNLLLPGAVELPEPDQTTTQLPTAVELVRAVADFLHNDLLPDVPAAKSFPTRIAGNALGIVERELALGPLLAEREGARLRALLSCAGETLELRRELASRLRQGLPLDTPGLDEHLRQSVAGQLAIDQPGYSALGAPLG